MKKFPAFIFAFVTAALLWVAPALSQPVPQDEVVWFKAAWNVGDIVLSPDGTKLYTGEYQDTSCVLRERNTSNGEIIRSFYPTNAKHWNDFIRIAVSKNGKYLAGICDPLNQEPSPIVVFNLLNGEEKQLTPDSVQNRGFLDIAISPDSKTIVGIYEDWGGLPYGYMTAFDIETGSSKYFKKYQAWIEPDTNLYSFYKVSYTPDGKNIVTIGGKLYKDPKYGAWRETMGLYIWDTTNYSCIKNIPLSVSKELGFSIKFDSISEQMGFDHNKLISFYNYNTWNIITTLTFPSNIKEIYSFGFSNNGQQVVASLYDSNFPHLTTSETLNIQPQQKLHDYDTLYFDGVCVSNDNQYFYGINHWGIYKINAYWQPSGLPPTIQPKEVMEIYPNPATNEMKIEINLQSSENCSVNITDETGKVVDTIFEDIIDGNKTLSYNTQDLPVGTYFMNIISSNGIETKKIVVSR